MTRTLLAVALLASSALAASALAQEAPRPRQTHFEVPDPLADEVPAPAPVAPEVPVDAAATADAVRPGGGGGGVARREQRAALGAAPNTLSGRFTVVQLTEGGATEDFRIKMDRAGRALHQDCITVAMVFDFGNAAAGLPNRVRLVERQECYKGGLGRYINEMALDLPLSWTKTEAGMVMTVPEIRATSGLVRLRRPEGDGLGTAPQWLGPETKVDRARTDYVVLAEPPKGRKPEGIAALHLTAGHQVLHLEPQAEAGPFGE